MCSILKKKILKPKFSLSFSGFPQNLHYFLKLAQILCQAKPQPYHNVLQRHGRTYCVLVTELCKLFFGCGIRSPEWGNGQFYNIITGASALLKTKKGALATWLYMCTSCELNYVPLPWKPMSNFIFPFFAEKLLIIARKGK